jgi:predicted phosphodiesterase
MVQKCGAGGNRGSVGACASRVLSAVVGRQASLELIQSEGLHRITQQAMASTRLEPTLKQAEPMKYLVISDVHSNLEALNAVLAQNTADRVVVLGDLVGYGADPNGVVDRIKRLQGVVIRGNHDRAACDGKLSGCWSYAAIASILWTMGELTAENRAYLMSLPKGPLVVDDEFEICHGSLEDEDGYVLFPGHARQNLDLARKRVCFFGHTHLPIAYSRLFKDVFSYIPKMESHQYDLKLRHMRSYLINPGSVGQPRDGDSRAAFAVFDTDAMHVCFRRIEYDVAGAQAKIEVTDLPQQLATRLSLGR